MFRSLTYFLLAVCFYFTVHAQSGFYEIGNVKWKFKTEGKVFSSPAIDGSLLFIGSADHQLYAVDTESGDLKWKVGTGGAVHSSPVVSKGAVYFLSFDGYFYSVDINSGKIRWKFATQGEKVMGDTSYWGMKPAGIYLEDLWDCFLSGAVVDETNATVYFGSSDHHLYAINTGDGSLKWKLRTGGSVHSTPTIYNGVVYVGSWDGKLYAVDASNGSLKWAFQTGTQTAMTGIQASPVVHEGVVLFGARDAHFYALDAASGSQIWKYNANNAWVVGSAVVSKDVVYFGTSDSYLLLGLDLKTGTERFRFKTHGYVFGAPLVKGNTAYVGDFTGKMFSIDLDGKTKAYSQFNTEGRKQFASTVLKQDTLDFGFASDGGDFAFYETSKKAMDKFYTLGPIISTPVMKNDLLYFGSADGFVYAVSTVARKKD